jgi:two-component system, chemotaxis family, protein-glutamate methylesterase/glutaminase
MAIRVLIVDDSAIVRETLKSILEDDPEIEVIGTAADPIIAAKKLETMVPDVITLDIEMPRMDGLSFLKALMTQHPLPVVICSSQSEAGSLNALKAMDYGAVDIIQKPKMGTKEFILEAQATICDTVKAAYAARHHLRKPLSTTTPQPKLNADAVLPLQQRTKSIDTTEKIVVVGASTGGTEALKDFLVTLPVDCPGIVIVQHMPAHFTKAFAQRLDSLCAINVKEAQDNDSVLRGTALIAPGNFHCLLKRSGARYYVEVKDGPLVSRHRPSVDVLFRSCARYAGKNAVGIIMTGMGDDGAAGMKELHDAGGRTIAQDEASCVVFGMPKEAIKLGGVDKIVALRDISRTMLQYIYEMGG